MAQVNQEHVNPLTMGWTVLLVGSLLLIGVLNHFADK
jgi:hypothetical protein